MNSASFVPEAADLIAANRLHFWTYLRWKRTVRAFILGGLALALTIALLGKLIAQWDRASIIIACAALGFVFWAVMLVLILALNYALIPRRSRHAFHQMKALRSETTVTWSHERIQLRSAQGSSDFDWRDFVRVAPGRDAILLFQSDYLFNFIPKRALSSEQAADLLGAAAARRT